MKKAKCETCEYKGYSTEICRYHSMKAGACEEERAAGSHHLLKRFGKAAAVGAGAGLAATFTGMAVAPIIGFKAVLGHAIAAKLSLGGGAAGAGVNVARKRMKGDECKTKPSKRKETLLHTYMRAIYGEPMNP